MTRRARVVLFLTVALAARGESLAAFDGRCIRAGCVAPPSNTAGILGRRALPAGRLARLGATPDFHHELLALPSASRSEQPQPKFPPDKFVNLQVFPKETKPDVLIQAMKNFTRDLGVRCPFCHVGKEGEPLTSFDFPSDANAHKNSARVMMRMAGEINAQLAKHWPDAPAKGYQVTCYTCL